jgi:ferritin-like protein
VTEQEHAELAKRYSILRYFEFDHLPDNLYEISRQFYYLAYKMAADLPYNPETSTCLRKLLEAKDCAVRAALDA